MINGGCFCGAINYEIQDGDYLVANCHCTMCRRISGAPFVTWLIVPKSAFRYTSGEPRLLQSSEKGCRFFCEKCGTPLAYESASRTQDIDLTTGSLSDPDRFVPTTSVYNENKLPWLGQTEFKDG